MSRNTQHLNQIASWARVNSILLVLGTVLLFASLFRFTGLSSESFWLDEIDSVEVARQSIWSLITEPAGNKQPLYFVTLGVWIDLFGESEVAVRSLSAIFGVLTVAGAFVLARRLAGNWWGIGAATLTALAASMVWYSQDARMYTLTAFLLVMSTHYLLKYDSDRRVRDLSLYVAFAFLGLYAHYYFLPFLASQLIGVAYFLAIRRDRREVLLWGVALLVLTLAFLSRINVVWHDLTTVQGTSFTEELDRLVPRIFQSIGPGNRASSAREFDIELAFVGILWSVIALGGIIAIWRRSQVVFLLLISFGSASMMLLGALIFELPVTLRYFVPIVPIWLVIGVWGAKEITGIAQSHMGRHSHFALTGVVMVAAIFAVLSISSWTDELDRTSRQQWRELSALLVERTNDTDVIHIMPTWYDRYLEFYLGNEPEYLNRRVSSDTWCENGQRVWLVNTSNQRPPDAVGESLAQNCVAVTSERFAGNLSATLFVSKQSGDGMALFCDGLVPTLIGTDDDEKLNGTSGDDVIVGLGGNDIINGQGGDDVICAGEGDDVINAGDGNDRVFGDQGDDTLNGSLGDDTLFGGDGDDTLNASEGSDNLYGEAGADTLNAGSGVDVAIGGPGDDVVNGGDGDDNIQGDDADDTLRGGPGNDTLDGGAGIDAADGGGGADTCLNSAETVRCEVATVSGQ